MNETKDFPESECHHLAGGERGTFKGRMRFHQSWYRNCTLEVPPGPNPSARGAIYGNMLTEEDGKAGRNFLTKEAHEAAIDRFPPSKQDSGTRRLYNNMLSSQPMCFNLFGPLKYDLGLATRLMRTLPGFPEHAVVQGIHFEYAPSKVNHLNDATAFDVFIEYHRAQGGIGFIGIETKLIEPFSQKSYPFDRYARWTSSPGWWWKQDAEKHFPDKRFNQLWRNHLLGFSMLSQPEPHYDEGMVAVVWPEGDTACTHAIEGYRQHLNPFGASTLLEWPLETIVSAWQSEILNEAETEWLQDFQTRYLDLDQSDDAWQEFCQNRKK